MTIRWGDSWYAAWPGVPADLDRPGVDGRRINGSEAVRITLDAVPRIGRSRVTVPADVEVLRIDFTGHGALHWGQSDLREQPEWFDAPESLSRYYCLRDECACPGTASAPVINLEPGPTVTVAVAGGTPGAEVTVLPMTVEDLCVDDPEVSAARPVEGCDDVLAIVQRHNSVYTSVRDVLAFDAAGFDDILYCEVSHRLPVDISNDSQIADPGLIQVIQVSFPTTAIPDYRVCGAAEGYCLDARTVHHPGDDRIPATSAVYTTVTTRYVELEAEEELHGTPTPPEVLVQIALEIEAGIRAVSRGRQVWSGQDSRRSR